MKISPEKFHFTTQCNYVHNSHLKSNLNFRYKCKMKLFWIFFNTVSPEYATVILVISVVSIGRVLIRVVTLGNWKFPTETPTEMRLRPEAAGLCCAALTMFRDPFPMDRGDLLDFLNGLQGLSSLWSAYDINAYFLFKHQSTFSDSTLNALKSQGLKIFKKGLEQIEACRFVASVKVKLSFDFFSKSQNYYSRSSYLWSEG